MSVLACKAANVAAFVVNLYLNMRYGKSIGLLSRHYDHIAVPAGTAFAIWGVIYCWELVWVLAQAGTDIYNKVLPSLTPWFCAGTLLQGAWVYVFTRSDPEVVGDFWVFAASALLLVVPSPFLAACRSLAALEGNSLAHWLSYGIAINAAWVFFAAGLTVNLVAVAAGLHGSALCAVSLLVLGASVVLLLVITGLVGSNPLRSPTAFFATGIWALFWVFQHLADLPGNAASARGQRLLPMYGTAFVALYKWVCLVLLAAFAGLEALVCRKRMVKPASPAHLGASLQPMAA
jgi:hypothetical protein